MLDSIRLRLGNSSAADRKNNQRQTKTALSRAYAEAELERLKSQRAAQSERIADKQQKQEELSNELAAQSAAYRSAASGLGGDFLNRGLLSLGRARVALVEPGLSEGLEAGREAMAGLWQGGVVELEHPPEPPRAVLDEPSSPA